MDDLETRLRERLPVDDFGALHPLLREFEDRGGTGEGAMAVLERLRAEIRDDGVEDRILELMDVATGFCAVQLRIW